MTYHVKHAGSIIGPFALDELRGMLQRGELDESALFRRIGTEQWLAEADLDDDAASPPPLPTVQEPQPLGFVKTVKIWALVFAGLFVLGLLSKLMGPPAPPPEVIAARNEQKRAADAERAANLAKESELIQLGREHGKKDGIEIAASVAAGQMAKPSRVHIISLGLARAYAEKISNTNDQIVFLRPYQEMFMESYKSTAEW